MFFPLKFKMPLIYNRTQQFLIKSDLLIRLIAVKFVKSVFQRFISTFRIKRFVNQISLARSN